MPRLTRLTPALLVLAAVVAGCSSAYYDTPAPATSAPRTTSQTDAALQDAQTVVAVCLDLTDGFTREQTRSHVMIDRHVDTATADALVDRAIDQQCPKFAR